MKRVDHIVKILFIVSAFLLAACGCGSDGPDGPDGATGALDSTFADGSSDLSSIDDMPGTLSLVMVDAPGGNYQAVYVTLKEIQVCLRNPACDGTDESEECECDWEIVADLEQTYNLLELVGGVMAELGQEDLEPGIYNQMRLILGDTPDDSLNILDQSHLYPQYLIDEAGVVREMKVPSGYTSGIKLVHPFEIVSGLTTELILDFDVSRSVIKAGNSGKYRLKPTIKVIGTYNRAIVSGVIDDGEGPLEGATVNAWRQGEDSGWSVAMSTTTDADGAYMLYLDLDLGDDYAPDPVDYKIVASADGYEPGCMDLTVEAEGIYPDTNLTLLSATMVTVEGTVTGTVDPESYPEDAPVVTISFNRTDGDCLYNPSVQTTVVGDNTADIFYDSGDGTFQYAYSVALPEGAYDATASCEGLNPVAVAIDLTGAASPVAQDFDF